MKLQETQARQQDTRDIVWGAIVNLVGALVRGLRIILFVVLGRLYGPEGVGLFLLAYATVETFSSLGILGLDQAVLTLIARCHADEDVEGVYRIVGQALFLGLTATLVVLIGVELSAPWLAQVFFKKPALALPLQIMAWALPFWTISAILLFATRALRVMQYEVITKGAVEPAVTLVLALGFYFLDLGLAGLWTAVLLAAMAGTIMAVYFFTRMLSLTRLWYGLLTVQGRWRLYRFAVPIGLVDLLNELLQRVDVFLVGRYLSAASLGIYGIAQETAAPIKKIRQAFNPIFIPVISTSYQQRDRASMLYQYRNVTRWILMLNACVVMGTVLAGRSLMGLFGAEFVVGFVAMVILSFALAIHGTLGVAELFILIDKPWINVVNAVGALMVSVVLNLVLIPRYGIIGAALAILLLYTTLNIVRLLEVAILYHLQPLTSYHATAAGAFAIALGTVWGIQTVRGAQSTVADISAVVLCWLFYFGLLVLLGLAPEERKVLERWRKRIRQRS